MNIVELGLKINYSYKPQFYIKTTIQIKHNDFI